MSTPYRIDSTNRVYVGRTSVGRILDGKPHSLRWVAVDRAGKRTRHETKAAAARHLARRWLG